LEAEFAVRPGKAIEIMRGREVGLAIDPVLLLKLGERTPARVRERPVDQLARAHREPRMARADALAERTDDLVVRAALPRRLDQLRPENDVLMPAALVDVVVFHEHGGGQ